MRLVFRKSCVTYFSELFVLAKKRGLVLGKSSGLSLDLFVAGPFSSAASCTKFEVQARRMQQGDQKRLGH